jgi:hypothetical protein
MAKDKDPKKDRGENKEEQGASRNLSNKMYGYEEGDDKPAAADAKGAENTASREGAVEKSAHKKGISYEPDNDVSGAQGAHGQGNAINKGTEGPQGYGDNSSDNYKDEDYDGAVGGK